jgi:hypothetical protein
MEFIRNIKMLVSKIKYVRSLNYNVREREHFQMLIDFRAGKQDFRRTDFGSRLLAAEGEGGGDSEGEGCV